jgi:oligosaccharide translocation protein RFT1
MSDDRHKFKPSSLSIPGSSTPSYGGSGTVYSANSIPPPPLSGGSTPSGHSGSPIARDLPATPLYRKHSRKRSSQVLIPPIQAVSRRRSVKTTSINGEGVKTDQDGSPIDSKRREKGDTSDDSPDINEVDEEDEEDDDDEMAFVDGSGRRRRSTVTAKTVASGATFLIGAQFFTKMVTFSLNHALLRFVSPGLVGANAQFELLINTILYFSREAVRLATQRQTLVGKSQDVYRFEGGVAHGTQSGTIQEVINIGFLPVLAGIPLAAIISGGYYYSWAKQLDQEYIGTAILLFAISAVIELTSEPSFVLSQLLMDFKMRASIESAAITVRCFLTFLFVMLSRKTWGPSIIAFALGQLAYSTVSAGLYTINGLKTSRHQQYKVIYPQAIWTEESHGQQKKIYFNQDTMILATGIWIQTFFKHLLTEGDKLLVSFVLPITDQGVYALVANYGSLAARLCFLPIEEALRGFFSKLLAASADDEQESSTEPSQPPTPPTTSPMSSSSSPIPTSSGTPSGTPSPTTNKVSDTNLSITVLSIVLRLYIYLGILACIFGPLCAGYLLSYMVSSMWFATDAPKVLATYACYIPFLALNGCLEAFVQSVATVEDIKRQSSVMVVFSVSFAVAGYILMVILHLGAQGLVYANMFNMALRIVWCTQYIEGYYRHQQTKLMTLESWAWLRPACPNRYVMTMSVAVAGAAWRIGWVQSLHALLKQGALAGILVATMAFYERELVMKSVLKVKHKH